MPEPSQVSNSQTIEPGNNWIAYLAIALFVALSYLLLLGRYIDFLDYVLPQGDPFTYTVHWFSLIDDYRTYGYLNTLVQNLIAGPDWYRLMDVGEAALAPILTKEPYSICIVNYALFGLATANFYRLGRRLNLSVSGAFAIALIPWIWPINYGFEDHTSLPVLALDAAFNAALFWAVAQAYIFCLDLRRAYRLDASRPSTTNSRFLPLRQTTSAILTGLLIGIAIWGRGNSLPVVGLVVLWPAVLTLWLAWRSRDARVWTNVIIVGAVVGLIAIQFYVQYWHALLDYYTVHTALVEDPHRTLKMAMPFVLNVPGFMYWRAENSVVCVALTFASHLFALLMLVLAWWPDGPFSKASHFASRHLIVGGAVIYFGTYLIDMALFANDESGFTIYQALLVWRPMLIGLSLILAAIAAELFARLGKPVARLIPVPLAMLALAWGLIWTYIYTPWHWADQRPSPRTVERFALNLDQLADNGKVAVLWYRGWNHNILNYYRIKNDLPLVNEFSYEKIANMWSMSDYSHDNRARTLDQVKYAFVHASLIVIAEFLDQYTSDEYYAFYRFKDDWAAWLNSDEAPHFRVVMLLQDAPDLRLLVLRRAELANGEGDPFRIPYGKRPRSPTPDYSKAVAQLSLAVPVVKGYNGFNILQVGRTFISVEQKEGAFDLVRYNQHKYSNTFSGPTLIDVEHKIDDAQTPQPLYTYRDYTVIRAGALYVGVSQDAGPMDVDAILTKAAPRPPDDEFIIADDKSSLEAKIDVYAKEAEAKAPPELLYAYKGYNVVRAGELYVGVAQELGPMDVRDVLTNAVPRPPSKKFLTAKDTSSLEAAIDAAVKDVRN